MVAVNRIDDPRAMDAWLNNLRVEPGEREQRRALTAEPEEDIQFSSVQFRRGPRAPPTRHAHSTTVSKDGSAPLGQHKY